MLILLLPLLMMGTSSGYRLLGFFPFPAPSHQNIFSPVLHALAVRGHHVVYLTPVPPKLSHPNLEVRTIKNFHQDFSAYLNFTRLGLATAPGVSHLISVTILRLAEQFYGQEPAQKIIHGSEHFDAVLIESYFAQEAVSALSHKFGCVAIEIATMGDSAWVNELAGLPNHPAYQMDFKSVLTDDLTFLERVYNAYVIWSTSIVSYYYLYRNQAVMDQYFNYSGWESRPPLHQMISNRSLILVNQDFALGYPQPLAPHVKNIGGVNLLPNKPLPQDIQRFMDEAPNGVIYFSLGSNLKTSEIVSGPLGKAFLKVFEKLPIHILMKWESDKKNPNLPKNILTSKWLPQQDVLAHPKCKVFVSHGGFLSLTEAAYHGVPLLGIPFFSDQPKNLKLAEQAGYGISLTFENVTSSSVSWALHELLYNPRYKKEAMRRSELLRDRRFSAQDEAVYWIEHAIKYPNSLTPRVAYLSFFKGHLIDLAAFFGLSLYLIWASLRLLFSIIVSSSSQKKLKVS